MKNIHEVMRQKELEIERLKRELEALRMVVPLLEDKEGAREVAASAPASAKPYSSSQPSNEPAAVSDTGKATRVWP